MQTLPRLSNKEDISLRRAKSYRKARSLSVPASVAKREDWTPMSRLKEHRSKSKILFQMEHFDRLFLSPFTHISISTTIRLLYHTNNECL